MARKSKSIPAAFLSALTIMTLALPHAARAQAVAVAEVSGTVTDPSGGVLPAAQVVMTETDKQLTRTTLTDTSGHYVLTNLPVGPYRLEVKAGGFKNYVQSGLTLQSNNNIQINVTMQVGAVTDRVEVTASAGLVETKRTPSPPPSTSSASMNCR